MSRELIDCIAEKLEQVSDDNEFLYRKSTGEIICRDPEFLDESTLEDIEVNWKDYILLPFLLAKQAFSPSSAHRDIPAV